MLLLSCLTALKKVVPFNFKVSNETRTAQTWIPMEPFKNVPEDQQKVGVATYDSDEQFNVRFTFVLGSFIRLLNLFFNPSLFII